MDEPPAMASRPVDDLPEAVRQVLPVLASRRVWLVGGAVRDRLLGRTTLDFDFAVAGDAAALGRSLANELGADYYDLDPVRRSGRLILTVAPGRRATLDFTALRGDGIEDDLRQRDFTINAMAIPLDDSAAWTLIDPLGGVRDLKDRRLRLCAATAVADDPVRAVRAIRLAVELGLRLEAEAVAAVRRGGAALGSASAERTRDELFRLLDLPEAGAGVRLLDAEGLLAGVIPEIEDLRGLEQPPPHALDAREHTLAVVDHLGRLLRLIAGETGRAAAADLIEAVALSALADYRARLREWVEAALSYGRRRRALLLWTALLHDLGKPRTQTRDPDGRIRFLGHETVGAAMAVEISRRLRLSVAEIAEVEMTVLHHLRPAWLEAEGPPTARAVYRFFRAAESAGVSVVLLSLADLLGAHLPPAPAEAWHRRVETAARLLHAWFDDAEARIRPPTLLSGEDVMRARRLPPGPTVGRLLESLREAQATGEVRTRAEALRYIEGFELSDQG